jgi:transposase
VFKVEVYARVRRAVQVEGMSMRQAAREFGLARKTIRKMLAYSVPPGYERKKPVSRPKLGPWLGIIDQILEDDKSQPKKQRHTAKRIWDRLNAEHGFSGGYTVVKDYVREARLQRKEVFVPLVHPPGDAQVDFGEALVAVGGEEQKAHFLCMDLPQSDDCFVRAFPARRTRRPYSNWLEVVEQVRCLVDDDIAMWIGGLIRRLGDMGVLASREAIELNSSSGRLQPMVFKECPKDLPGSMPPTSGQLRRDRRLGPLTI